MSAIGSHPQITSKSERVNVPAREALYRGGGQAEAGHIGVDPGPASTKPRSCWAEDNVSSIHGKPCREKEAKLKEAKAALTSKSASARRHERTFQTLYENAVQLVRLASV